MTIFNLPATVCLTADPDFTDLALNELRSAAPPARTTGTLAPGVLLIDGVDFFSLAATWHVTPPIFVRHICPVMAAARLYGGEDDLEIMADLLRGQLLEYVEPSLPFSVQTRIFEDGLLKPFDVNRALSSLVEKATAAPLDVRAPQQILSVVIGNVAEMGGAAALMGVSPTLYNLSDWAGGMRRFAREKEQISRAEFKLLEALEVFGIELPPRGVALDLGASPGGWTRVLRGREQYVTAIDPGELDPRLMGDPAVRHLRMTAEAYLAGEPERFDLIVNDMRMDARDSARLMVDYAPLLYADGQAIMTLKLPARGRRAIIERAFEILRQAYEIQGARQLFHNRSEITVYLTRGAIG
ncbi:MAG: 50S rRNA methyltransferase [Caldilineaceae bacterium]|nr:50S rRNA methyltransferase [Caldilineaceae bacterium]